MVDQGTVWRVLEAFSFDAEGRPWVMRRGDLVGESHPAFKVGRPYLEQVDAAALKVSSTRARETASAAPGERRAVTRPTVKS